MSTFDIPTGLPMSENMVRSSRVVKRPARPEDPVTSRQCGSITYDQDKKGMSWEWANEDAFWAWLAAEEWKHAIELVVSQVEHSKSPIWRERRLLKCVRGFTGGKREYQRTTASERKIPSKKTGCRCRLTVKSYPHTETILGWYEDKHD